jgi:phosphatidate cytidylyltransferase
VTGGVPVPTVVIRTLAGLALGLPVLLFAWIGTPAFEVMVALAAGILAWEWFRITGSGQSLSSGLLLGCVVVIAVAIAAGFSLLVALAALAFGTALVVLVTRGAPWMTLGTLYIGLPCVALVWLRNEPALGREIVLWLLLVVWASDIGAYAAGRLIGGPKLAPQISPNKTWAGLVGGISAAAAMSVAFASHLGGAHIAPAAILGALLAVAAQLGDLGESWVKRRFGVKDASTLIPGHGGLLDRVDALLVVILIVACIAAADKGALNRWL